MGIFRAIGLGIGIIILSRLMPEVYGAFEEVLLKFFGMLNSILAMSEQSISDGTFMPSAMTAYPQIPHY